MNEPLFVGLVMCFLFAELISAPPTIECFLGGGHINFLNVIDYIAWAI